MEQTEPKELILHRKNGMMEVWTRVVQNGVVSGRAGHEGDTDRLKSRALTRFVIMVDSVFAICRLDFASYLRSKMHRRCRRTEKGQQFCIKRPPMAFPFPIRCAPR
jgi:hypothetical protein